MNHPDETPLLNDILEDEKLAALRHASLDQGLDAMRRTRRFRRAMRTGTLASLTVLLILTLTLHRSRQKMVDQPSALNASRAGEASSLPGEFGVQMITDEELFALLPNRAVALVGKPGHQELVLLDAPARH